MNAADLLKWYDDHIKAAEALRDRHEAAGLDDCVLVDEEEIIRLKRERVLYQIRLLRERIERKEGAK